MPDFVIPLEVLERKYEEFQTSDNTDHLVDQLIIALKIYEEDKGNPIATDWFTESTKLEATIRTLFNLGRYEGALIVSTIAKNFAKSKGIKCELTTARKEGLQKIAEESGGKLKVKNLKKNPFNTVITLKQMHGSYVHAETPKERYDITKLIEEVFPEQILHKTGDMISANAQDVAREFFNAEQPNYQEASKYCMEAMLRGDKHEKAFEGYLESVIAGYISEVFLDDADKSDPNKINAVREMASRIIARTAELGKMPPILDYKEQKAFLKSAIREIDDQSLGIRGYLEGYRNPSTILGGLIKHPKKANFTEIDRVSKLIANEWVGSKTLKKIDAAEKGTRKTSYQKLDELLKASNIEIYLAEKSSAAIVNETRERPLHNFYIAI